MGGTLGRAVVVFRLAALLLSVALAVHTAPRYAHPGRAVVVLAAMAVWTVVAAVPLRGRAVAVLRVADVCVTVAAVLATRLVDTQERIAGGAATLPVGWAAAAPLAAGVTGGPWAGGAAGLAVAVADVLERGAVTAANVNSGILLVVAGGIAGSLARLLARARAAEARTAADSERSRLAADIHDSVLQVLALIARGGGDARALARLAGEQEVALRALVRTPDPVVGRLDLVALLLPLSSADVEVVVPATAVRLEGAAAQAIRAVVVALFENVRLHAGPDARAWVLVEDEDERIRLTVRDDGLGIGPGRLAAAAAGGRLGMAESVRGRVRALGGTVVVTSAPGAGTEVEVCVPRG